jgi:hypothetical protein
MEQSIIYLISVLLSAFTLVISEKAYKDYMEKRDMCPTKESQTMARKTLKFIRTFFTIFLPVYNIVMMTLSVLIGEQYFSNRVEMDFIADRITYKDSPDASTNKKEKEETPFYDYNNMTTAQKIEALEREKAKLSGENKELAKTILKKINDRKNSN